MSEQDSPLERSRSTLRTFFSQIPIAIALTSTLRAGYGKKNLAADAMAGVVVGIIALPLSMALAIATGVPPQYGLYTAIIAGVTIALMGGSKVQVSGPTAAFVVILAPIVTKFGLGGLLLATLMAGGFLILFGLLRLGRLIEFVPSSVTTGFTAGIAVVLASLQLKDFLGLQTGPLSEHFFARSSVLLANLPTAQITDVFIGLLTLLILIIWPRLVRTVPAALVALTAASCAALLVNKLMPGFAVETINTRFTYLLDGQAHPGIPRLPPLPAMPWTLPGPQGVPLTVTPDLLRQLVPPAFAIALLGAIESLLSAIVADRMSGHHHDPDGELVAQGFGNVIAPFFGGFAATGAIARTAANVRAGAQSPFAAVIHAVFVLATILLFAPILGYLPMAALAALLLVVAWNMSEARHFAHTLRVAPKSDILVLVTCFLLTVIFDMTIAVTAGVLLAAVMFMRRMAEVFDVRIVRAGETFNDVEVPDGVNLVAFTGPLFFGAAQKAISRLEDLDAKVATAVVDLAQVPAIDATGLFHLDTAIADLRVRGVRVILVGLQPQPARALARAGWYGKDDDGFEIRRDVAELIEGNTLVWR